MGHAKRGLGLILAVGLVAGCATSASGPTSSVAAYPSKGQSTEQQTKDTGECDTWARQQSGYDPTTDTAKSAGIGVAVGAVLGAATGAAIGAATGAGAGRGAATGAVIGGVGGGVGGGAYGYSKSKEGWQKAYAACMQGRGYSVSQ